MSLKSLFGKVVNTVKDVSQAVVKTQVKVADLVLPTLANAVAPGSGQLVKGLTGAANNLLNGSSFSGTSLAGATDPVKEAAASQLQFVAELPAIKDMTQVLNIASTVAENVRAAGGTTEQAQAAAQVAQVAAQAPPEQAKGIVEDVIKPVIKKGLEGLKDGLVDGFMDTEAGQAAKKEAINKEGTKMVPWALGALALFVMLKGKR